MFFLQTAWFKCFIEGDKLHSPLLRKLKMHNLQGSLWLQTTKGITIRARSEAPLRTHGKGGGNLCSPGPCWLVLMPRRSLVLFVSSLPSASAVSYPFFPFIFSLHAPPFFILHSLHTLSFSPPLFPFIPFSLLYCDTSIHSLLAPPSKTFTPSHIT